MQTIYTKMIYVYRRVKSVITHTFISYAGSSKEWNVSKDNQDDDRMYDAPWGDVDSVINSIIKEKIQHKATVTTDKKIPSLNKDNRRHSVMPLKLGTDSSTDQKCTGGKKITPPIHSRQTSVPNFRYSVSRFIIL